MNRGKKNKYENHCLVTRNYKTFTDQVKIILQLPPSQQNRWRGLHIDFYISKVCSTGTELFTKGHHFTQFQTTSYEGLTHTVNHRTFNICSDVFSGKTLTTFVSVLKYRWTDIGC